VIIEVTRSYMYGVYRWMLVWREPILC